MHAERKNTQKEVELLKILFSMPLALKIIYVCAMLVCFILFIVGCVTETVALIVVWILLLAITILVFIFHKHILGNKNYVITNLRIRGEGKFYSLFSMGESFRFEEIDDVEIKDFIGLNKIIIRYRQGHIGEIDGILGKPKKLTLRYVDGLEQTYVKLVELLVSTKNEQDVLWQLASK